MIKNNFIHPTIKQKRVDSFWSVRITQREGRPGGKGGWDIRIEDFQIICGAKKQFVPIRKVKQLEKTSNTRKWLSNTSKVGPSPVPTSSLNWISKTAEEAPASLITFSACLSKSVRKTVHFLRCNRGVNRSCWSEDANKSGTASNKRCRARSRSHDKT